MRSVAYGLVHHYQIMLRKVKSAKNASTAESVGVQGYTIFISPWRERQVPFYGLWEFLGFLENTRIPKYPNLQASEEKHAIHLLYMFVYSKNLNMD